MAVGPPSVADSPSIAAPPPTRSPAASPALIGERRQVTVVFADISGFTALSERLDPEAVRQLMNQCFACLVPIVERYGGTVDKFIGDEIMALFGAPVAHENDAERAVRAALAMMAALTDFNAEQGTDLGLHCGINTGVVIAGGLGSDTRQDYSVMGDAVNLAARLEDASERGEIFVGPETYRLTRPFFQFEALPPMTLKGKAEPVPVYRVLGLSGVQSRLDAVGARGLTPLVGREHDLGVLLERWAQAQDGRGQVVLLSGEAGIGKSRLLHVLDEHLIGAAHTRLICRSSPYYHDSALYPLIDLLHRTLHAQSPDGTEPPHVALAQLLEPYHLARPTRCRCYRQSQKDSWD